MRFFHRHRFDPIKVIHSNYAWGGADVTVILKRCSCGKNDTERIDGHWPVELFMGPKKENGAA